MAEEKETRLKRVAAQGAQKMWAFRGLQPEGVLTYQDLIHEGCQSKQQPQLPSPDWGSQKAECEGRSNFAEAF